MGGSPSIAAGRFAGEKSMARCQAIAASPNPVVRRRHWKSLVLAGLLVAGTLTVYLQAARFGYMTVDDAAYAFENVHVQQGITWANRLEFHLDS